MIVLGTPARMVCIEKGCPASEPAELVLLAMGTFGLRLTEAGKSWQVAMDTGNPGSPMLCRCPEHRSKLTTPPAAAKSILRSINGH